MVSGFLQFEWFQPDESVARAAEKAELLPGDGLFIN
jgi:hypothetical protein